MHMHSHIQDLPRNFSLSDMGGYDLDSDHLDK
jgi:hypothetical protein